MADNNQALTRSAQKNPAIMALESTANINHLKELFGDERAGVLLANITSMVAQKPDLADCDARSIFASAMQAISLGLSIVPSVGHCAIIAYSDKQRGKVATFQIMWRGLAQIAMRNGLDDFDVQPAIAGEVKKFDRARRLIEFDEDVLATKPEYVYNAGLKIKPKNIAEAVERAKPFVGSWAYVTVKGVTKWHYITIEDAIKKAKSSSPSYYFNKDSKTSEFGSTSFWVTRLVEMTNKTAFLSLKQFLPNSEKMSKALEIDTANARAVDVATGEIIDAPKPAVIAKDRAAMFGEDVVDAQFTEEPSESE